MYKESFKYLTRCSFPPGPGWVPTGCIHTVSCDTVCSTAARSIPDEGKAWQGLPLSPIRAAELSRWQRWWNCRLDRRPLLQRVKMCSPELVVLRLQTQQHQTQGDNFDLSNLPGSVPCPRCTWLCSTFSRLLRSVISSLWRSSSSNQHLFCSSLLSTLSISSSIGVTSYRDART